MIKIWKNTMTLDAFIPELASVCGSGEAELAVIGGKSLDLDQLPKLRGLFKCGIGRDNVPESDCADRGIEVCFPSEETCGVIYEETANFTVHLIFQMLYAEVGVLEGWKKFARPFLGEKTVLLIGTGNIGRRVHHKLRAFTRVTTYDVLDNIPTELPGLMACADVVSIHIPFCESTQNFLDTEKLGWMRDGAALVNTARGAIVDERALLREIQSSRLRAAFDAFWQEPYEGPLREFHPDRFLMTPHVASTCVDFLEGLAGDLNVFIDHLTGNQVAK